MGRRVLIELLELGMWQGTLVEVLKDMRAIKGWNQRTRSQV